MTASEIIFEVREDEVDGGFNAHALGHDIFTQADSLEELRAMVKDAVICHFGEQEGESSARPNVCPNIIRLHFVRDEVFAVQ